MKKVNGIILQFIFILYLGLGISVMAGEEFTINCQFPEQAMLCDYHYPNPSSKDISSKDISGQLKCFLLQEKTAKMEDGVISYMEKSNHSWGQSWKESQKDNVLCSFGFTDKQPSNNIFSGVVDAPYANSSHGSVTVESTRELGHDIAKILRVFFQEEIDSSTTNILETIHDEDYVPYNAEGKYLCISGVYPHLTAYNQDPAKKGDGNRHGEAGIGALVPWAGKLWYLTYPQHQVKGSNDKLYSVDKNFHLTVEKQSLGGTHANRLIHRESHQLFMGYYAIDEQGKIRTFDPEKLVGRMTSTMRHLKDPANKIYFYDMEGAIYEANVKSLEVTKLFEKPFPGWHGKGAWTGGNRVVFANNGGTVGQSLSPHLKVGGAQSGPEDAGVLGQWDGSEKFEIIKERQFTDVTGPGGIYGANSPEEPIWTMGWDKRSVMLMLLDHNKWSMFRVPKASWSFDPKHGWYTEWPRIRETFPNKFLMCMHASLFDFPKTFSEKNTAGLRPITTHLRYIPDFCSWQDLLVLASDETAMQGNPPCGQAQSNLWFGTMEEVRRFGPQVGWGGLWIDDSVKASVPSCGYLFAGYQYRVLHLKAAPGSSFRLEFDVKGNNNWTEYKTLTVTDNGYLFHLFHPADQAEWIRLVPLQDGIVSAGFHYLTPRLDDPKEQKIFDALANVKNFQNTTGGIIRPATRNRSLQWLKKNCYKDKGEITLVELKKDASGFDFTKGTSADDQKIRTVAGRNKLRWSVDSASVLIVDEKGERYRLPKGSKEFDTLNLRDLREVESERYLANIHGTFYEVPRLGITNKPWYMQMKPVCSHAKMIDDFCTWRGLLVLCGTQKKAVPDGQFFSDEHGDGLWFGQVDDLWKMGKPKGEGAPLYKMEMKAGIPSDRYLMTGYDKKKMILSHNLDKPVIFTIEVDFDFNGFVKYKTIEVKPGENVEHLFPDGYSAHWLRVSVDQDCNATAWCIWE